MLVHLQHNFNSRKCIHDDVMEWKHFPRYWPLCGKFTGHQWIPLTKASNVELWCFLWSVPEQTNGWINKRCAHDLRCHRAHYGVIVMWECFLRMSSTLFRLKTLTKCVILLRNSGSFLSWHVLITLALPPQHKASGIAASKTSRLAFVISN